MNKHLRLAFMVAPFLAVFGYIGADYYGESVASQEKIIEMAVDGQCDILGQACVLKSKNFKINVLDEAGITTVNSTFPLDSATLFLVDKNNNMTAYPLGMNKDPYYWRSETPLRDLVSNKDESYKLRLIAKIKGGQYIAEFYTQTAK